MAVGINPKICSPPPEETLISSNQLTITQKSHARPSQPQTNFVDNQSISPIIDLNPSIVAPQRSFSDIVRGRNQSPTSEGIQPILINNHQDLDFTSIGLKPTSSYQGKPAVLFSLSEKQLLVDKLKYVLVGKFSHGKPNLVRIRGFLGGLKLKGSCSVAPFDKKHIFIECVCKIDFYRIWLKLVWFIDGFPMRVFKWTADFSPLKESPIVPVWVRLEGLPLFLFDELSLLSVANSIGKPIRVDPRNVARSIVNSASICVELDVSQPLLQELWVNFEDDKTGVVIEGYGVKVSYVVIPFFCGFCSHIGHEIGNCKRRVEKQVRNKGSDADSEVVLATQETRNEPAVQQPKSSVKFVEGPQKNVIQQVAGIEHVVGNHLHRYNENKQNDMASMSSRKGGQQVLGMLANQVLSGSHGVLGSIATQSDLEEAKDNSLQEEHIAGIFLVQNACELSTTTVVLGDIAARFDSEALHGSRMQEGEQKTTHKSCEKSAKSATKLLQKSFELSRESASSASVVKGESTAAGVPVVEDSVAEGDTVLGEPGVEEIAAGKMNLMLPTRTHKPAAENPNRLQHLGLEDFGQEAKGNKKDGGVAKVSSTSWADQVDEHEKELQKEFMATPTRAAPVFESTALELQRDLAATSSKTAGEETAEKPLAAGCMETAGIQQSEHCSDKEEGEIVDEAAVLEEHISKDLRDSNSSQVAGLLGTVEGLGLGTNCSKESNTEPVTGAAVSDANEGVVTDVVKRGAVVAGDAGTVGDNGDSWTETVGSETETAEISGTNCSPKNGFQNKQVPGILDGLFSPCTFDENTKAGGHSWAVLEATDCFTKFQITQEENKAFTLFKERMHRLRGKEPERSSSLKVLAARSISPVGRSSEKMSKLRKRIENLKYEQGRAIVLEEETYKALEEYQQQLVSYHREKRQASSPKDSTPIADASHVIEQDRTTRKGRNRKKEK